MRSGIQPDTQSELQNPALAWGYRATAQGGKFKSIQKILMRHKIIIIATKFHHVLPDTLLNALDTFSPLALPTAL